MIQKDNIVRMNDKYYVDPENRNKLWKVSTDPWIVCKIEAVGLQGYPGCYATDGLDIAEVEDTLEKAILLKMSKGGVNTELSVKKCAKIFNMQEEVVIKRLNHLVEMGWLKDLGTAYRLLFEFDLNQVSILQK